MRLSNLHEAAPDFKSFQQWLQDNNISIKDLITNISSNPPDGRGGNANFWIIPNSPYGLRIVRRNSSSNQPNLQSTDDPFPDENFGQAIAKLSDNITIVKLQQGSPLGLKHGAWRNEEDGLRKEIQSFKAKLIQTASLPVESYVKLIQQLQYINNKGYTMDPSKPGNLLIDNTGFHLVDLNQSNSGYRNDPGEIIIMAMGGNYYFSQYLSEDQEAIKAAQLVIKKCEQAAAMANTPIKMDSSVDYSYKLARLK